MTKLWGQGEGLQLTNLWFVHQASASCKHVAVYLAWLADSAGQKLCREPEEASHQSEDLKRPVWTAVLSFASQHDNNDIASVVAHINCAAPGCSDGRQGWSFLDQFTAHELVAAQIPVLILCLCSSAALQRLKGSYIQMRAI